MNSKTWYQLPKIPWTSHQDQYEIRHLYWYQELWQPNKYVTQCGNKTTIGYYPCILPNQTPLWFSQTIFIRLLSPFLILDLSDINFPRSVIFGGFDKWNLYQIFHSTSILQVFHNPCPQNIGIDYHIQTYTKYILQRGHKYRRSLGSSYTGELESEGVQEIWYRSYTVWPSIHMDNS